MPASGRNITFKIYNSDNQPFHNLVLHKATYDSVVMSLGDKITGDVYYKDTSLVCSMHEYIVYNGVQYTLVNPPTIVREGMVSDNSDLKGMTKYSFEFYHPMYMLNNLPFTDIAVSNDELRYKSQDKIFSWVGYFPDYIAKINKNLEGTQWVCEQGANIPQDTLSKISDVLAFSDNTIGDALKTEYETWGIPFVIDILSISDARYAQGKRYLIYFGQPANEIYESEEAKEAGTPFVFRFGQGVGLKNNSATPRNNKIITRLAGYGSERNVPFGYPQIVWDEDDDESDLQYPLYDGIVGGRWVKLIKHPFTRSHLMPTIYAETVARKVNPRADYYDPDTEIIDYHDALDGNIFPHTINPLAPSYEIHEFENIFPELGEKHIVSVQPINDDLTDADSWDDSMDDNGDYKQSYFKLTLPQLDFDIYACAAITQEMQINMRSGACVGCTFDVQVDWDDYKKNFYDENNNFAPDGSQRDLTKYPKSNNGQITIICQKDLNTFGTIMPNIYQKPRGVENENEYDGDTFVILGISLPESYITNAQHRLDEAIDQYMLENNVYYYDYPLKFDEYFLATHTYILSQIKNNTIVRFEFQGNIIPLYVKQLTIKYGDSPLPQYNITLTDNIDVVINQIAQVSGDVSKMQSQLAWLQTNVGKNQGNGTDVTKLSRVNDDTANGIINFVQGLTAGNWLESSSGAAIHQNSNGNWVVEADYVNARKKIQANEVEILHSSHIGGRLIATPASMLVSRVEYINDYETTYQRTPWQGACYKCYFNTTDDDGNQIYNTFKQGDLAYCETFNLVTSSDGISHLRTGNHFYWRKVIETGSDYIILSNVIGEYAADSDYPFVGDHITLLGSQAQIEPAISPIDGQAPSYEQWETDTERQNAVIIAGAGAGNPFIRVYKGIDDFYLPQPDVQISPNGSWITVNDGNGNDVNITTLIENLQEQVDQAKEQDDRQIVLWFGDVQPTLENAPAEDWVTEQIKHEHINDIYYNRNKGLAYSFTETIENNIASYSWELLTDQDVLRSLELAAQAQDTADGKRRVFVSRPTQAQAYDIGDLWVNVTFPTQYDSGITIDGVDYDSENPLYNNDVLRCAIAKVSGDNFSIYHWQPVQEYTTSKIEQTADRISLSVTSGLERTGIDITNGKIELNAANTVVSNTLSVTRLETQPDTSVDATNKAKVQISGSTMNVFGATGIMNIQFGVDDEGYAVLKYYDNDGFLLYDLGPHGIRTLDISSEGFDYYDFYKVAQEGANDTSDTLVTLGKYHPKKIATVVSAGSIAGNNDAIAAEASGKWFTTTTYGAIISTIVDNGALDTSILANGTYRLTNEIFSMSDLELYGNNISDAKADLILQTGISQAQADAFDWELDASQPNFVLKRTIYWREYTTFVNGIEQPTHITVWQAE